MQGWLRVLTGISVGGLVACGESDGRAPSQAAGALQEETNDSPSNASAAGATPRTSSEPSSTDPSGDPRRLGARVDASSSGGAGGAASNTTLPSGRSPDTSGASGQSGPLPDLILDEAYLLDSTRFDTQRIDDPCAVQQGCATGLGERRVVRFGSRMGNVGDADFVLGVPEAGNPLWTLEACSDRFSLGGFARYELTDASTGKQVLLGSKSEFCMTDAEEWIAGSGAKCQTYTCKDQGIRPGCADNYGTDLPCQWLDVTDVPPGEYQLLVTVNAARTVVEQDYANDSVRLRLRIDADGGGAIER